MSSAHRQSFHCQLSDKYDRDRLSTSNGLRGKDRETAPHLSVGTSRLSSGTALTGRRGEGRERGEGRGEREREGGTRRKAGESIDDWRRGKLPHCMYTYKI